MKVELKGMDGFLAVMNPKVYTNALNRTVNDIGSKANTQMVKEARKIYNIKAKDLKQFIKVKRSSNGNMTYSMDIRSRGFNAKRFGAKSLKKNGSVSVRIRKDRGRKTIKRAFIAKSGAVLQREEGSQKIRAVTTVSIPQMFNEKILKDADKMVSKEFGSRLQTNFDFYIGKV